MRMFFRRLLGREEPDTRPPPPPSPPNGTEIARAVREAEAESDVEPGRLLHRFVYDELTIRFDRDVIGLLRITASRDDERRYSFSVRCAEEEWDDAFETVFAFLASDRSLANLPNDNRVRGHFYGYSDVRT